MILLLSLLLLCDVTQASPGAEVYSSLPAPVNVTVSLWQLRYTVRWSSGPHTPAGTHYHVKTLALDHSVREWVSVPGCERVSVCEDASVCEGASVNVCVCKGASVCECVCDVTEVFWNLEETYYTQVTAQLGGRSSNHSYQTGFKPIENTEPLPPLASLGLSNQSQLSISLQPPADWLRPLYSLYKYNISIHTHLDQPPVSVECGLGGYELSELVPGRQYCVSVSIVKHQNTLTHTTPHCLTAPAEFNTDVVLSVLLCVCVVACLASLPLLVYSGFFCLRVPLPNILLSFSASRLLRLLKADDPQMTPVSVATTLPKDSQSESSDEDDEEEEGGRRGAYERRVQDSPSPSDTALLPSDTALTPSDTALLSLDTALLPLDTERYAYGRNLLDNSGSTTHTHSDTDTALSHTHTHVDTAHSHTHMDSDKAPSHTLAHTRTDSDTALSHTHTQTHSDTDMAPSHTHGRHDGENTVREMEEDRKDGGSIDLFSVKGEKGVGEDAFSVRGAEDRGSIDLFSVKLRRREGEEDGEKEGERDGLMINLFSVRLREREGGGGGEGAGLLTVKEGEEGEERGMKHYEREGGEEERRRDEYERRNTHTQPIAHLTHADAYSHTHSLPPTHTLSDALKTTEAPQWEEEEEDDDDDDDDCSGYMRRN